MELTQAKPPVSCVAQSKLDAQNAMLEFVPIAMKDIATNLTTIPARNAQKSIPTVPNALQHSALHVQKASDLLMIS